MPLKWIVNKKMVTTKIVTHEMKIFANLTVETKIYKQKQLCILHVLIFLCFLTLNNKSYVLKWQVSGWKRPTTCQHSLWTTPCKIHLDFSENKFVLRIWDKEKIFLYVINFNYFKSVFWIKYIKMYWRFNLSNLALLTRLNLWYN